MPQAISGPSTNGVITVADLAVREGEARIRDLDLARGLEMADPHAIRRTIRKYRSQLESFGPLVSDIDRKAGPAGGRPGITHLLNRKQALYVTAKSETEKAAEATVMMVEVFDAHLAARAAPPPSEPAPLAPVPFLPGPERLVCTLHLAQALRRRHTGVLRLADVLAAERPDLLGPHLRFATYLHENGRPYRCFHLDRLAFDALLARIPSSDHLAAALRDATLRGWTENADAPAMPAPDSTAPASPPALSAAGATIERDGFAAMRLGGELLLVDLLHLDVGIGTRAVVIGWDEKIVVQDMSEARSNAKFLGDRNFVLPDPSETVGIRSVWAVGTVVATQPAATPGETARRETRTAARRVKPPRACPARAPRADLAAIEVCGTA